MPITSGAVLPLPIVWLETFTERMAVLSDGSGQGLYEGEEFWVSKGSSKSFRWSKAGMDLVGSGLCWQRLCKWFPSSVLSAQAGLVVCHDLFSPLRPCQPCRPFLGIRLSSLVDPCLAFEVTSGNNNLPGKLPVRSFGHLPCSSQCRRHFWILPWPTCTEGGSGGLPQAFIVTGPHHLFSFRSAGSHHHWLVPWNSPLLEFQRGSRELDPLLWASPWALACRKVRTHSLDHWF